MGEPSECMTAGCREDSDCGERQICDPQDSVCVDVECTETSDCDSGEVCDPQSNSCGECFVNADCGAGLACDTVKNECEPTDEVYASGNGILCAVKQPAASGSAPWLSTLLGLLGMGLLRRRRARKSGRRVAR
jgi:hypothetical protein